MVCGNGFSIIFNHHKLHFNIRQVGQKVDVFKMPEINITNGCYHTITLPVI